MTYLVSWVLLHLPGVTCNFLSPTHVAMLGKLLLEHCQARGTARHSIPPHPSSGESAHPSSDWLQQSNSVCNLQYSALLLVGVRLLVVFGSTLVGL